MMQLGKMLKLIACWTSKRQGKRPGRGRHLEIASCQGSFLDKASLARGARSPPNGRERVIFGKRMFTFCDAPGHDSPSD